MRWPKVEHGVDPVQTDLAQAHTFCQGLERPLTRAGACRMQKVHRYRWPGAVKARQRTDFGGGRSSDDARRCTDRCAADIAVRPRFTVGLEQYGPRCHGH